MTSNKEWHEMYKQHAKEMGMKEVHVQREPFEEVRIVNPTDGVSKKFSTVDAPPKPKIPKPHIWYRTKKVLRSVVSHPIFGLVIELTPKPIRIMLKWIKDRLKEPSTYQGITLLASIVGWSLSPEMWEAIATLGASAIGLIQVIKKEQKEAISE